MVAGKCGAETNDDRSDIMNTRSTDSVAGMYEHHCTAMMMIVFITIKSSLVPLIEGLCAQI